MLGGRSDNKDCILKVLGLSLGADSGWTHRLVILSMVGGSILTRDDGMYACFLGTNKRKLLALRIFLYPIVFRKVPKLGFRTQLLDIVGHALNC